MLMIGMYREPRRSALSWQFYWIIATRPSVFCSFCVLVFLCLTDLYSIDVVVVVGAVFLC